MCSNILDFSAARDLIGQPLRAAELRQNPLLAATNREHWATGKVVVLLKKQLYRCYALSKHWELKQRLADDSSVASLAFNALGACGYPNASLAFCSMATQMLWRSVLFFAKLQHLGTFSRAAATSLQPCHLRWHHHILHWVTGLILQRAASLQVNCFTSVTAALRSLGRGAQW